MRGKDRDRARGNVLRLADSKTGQEKTYRIDYSVASAAAPQMPITGFRVPLGSAVYSCTAIGFTDKRVEHWFPEGKAVVECVGIPGYPGSTSPRVAGLIRFAKAQAGQTKLQFVHGDVLRPRGFEKKLSANW